MILFRACPREIFTEYATQVCGSFLRSLSLRRAMEEENSSGVFEKDSVFVNHPPVTPLSRMPAVPREPRGDTMAANIAAIDFGTTYCSLAFKTQDDSGVTVVRLDGTNRRVPNAILLKIVSEESICMVCKEAQCADKRQSCTKAATPMSRMVTKQYNCTVHSFGAVAQGNYERIRKNQYSNHVFFERVKISLMQKQVGHIGINSYVITDRYYQYLCVTILVFN